MVNAFFNIKTIMKANIFTFLLIVPLSCCMLSCSSDNDEETQNPPTEIVETPEDNLPEEAKTFLGYWINQGNKGGDFIFWSDGTCWMFPLESYSSHQTSYHQEGYWTYDTATKILATTTGQWQWQVTLSNSEAWTGFSLGNSKTTYTFKKGDNLSFMKMMLSESSWEETADSTMNLSEEVDTNPYAMNGDYRKGYVFSGSLHITKPLKYGNFSYPRALIIKENEDADDYVFNYEIVEFGTYRNRIGGVVTLKNPNNLKKQELEFTGGLHKLLYRVTEKKE